MLKWRLYYGDGTTFDSTMGLWEDAPWLNVGLLTTRDTVPSSNLRHAGAITWPGDFYLWWPGEEYPRSVDWAGLLDYLGELGEGYDLKGSDLSLEWLAQRGVKFGRSLPEQQWSEIRKLAFADPDFPRSSLRVAGRAV